MKHLNAKSADYDWFVRCVMLGAGLCMTAVATAGQLNISICPGSEAGGLNIRSPHYSGDVFDFRACECVVVGKRALACSGNGPEDVW